MLIPPVMILGWSRPASRAARASFMSPVVASLLDVPDPTRFVTTFLTFYPGSCRCSRRRLATPRR